MNQILVFGVSRSRFLSGSSYNLSVESINDNHVPEVGMLKMVLSRAANIQRVFLHSRRALYPNAPSISHQCSQETD